MYYKLNNNYPVVSPIKVEDDFIEYTVGAEPQELLDAIKYQEDLEVATKALAEAKQAKELTLSTITVTTASGKVFDGRPMDIPLMSGAIQASEVLGMTEAQWRLYDNTVEVVTLDELKEALALAMVAIGEIKTGVSNGSN